MRKLEDFVKAVNAIEPNNLKAADELKKEIPENREIMADLKNKTAKEPVKKELISDLETHTTKPHIPTHMDCSVCGERKTIRGMPRHIKAKHPEDLKDPENQEIPEDLEGPENQEIPEDLEIQENQEIPEDLEIQEEIEKKFKERRKINLIPRFLFSPFDRRRQQLDRRGRQ